MAISSQNALLNQYAPPFCIGSPVNGEALLYNSTKKVWENRPITATDLANVVPVDLVWAGDTFGPGDVVTISNDLQTFVSVPRADFGNPVSLGDLSDVDLIAPLLDGEVLTFNSTTSTWTNEPGGGAGAVTSVFGRTGAVVAVSGDYSTSLVTNASGVAGTTDTDALNTLNSVKADKVSGATNGNIAGLNASGNLTDSGIAASDLTNLIQLGDPNTLLVNTAGYITLAQVPAAPVTSVFGRTGVVVAQEGDYLLDQLGDVDVSGVSTPGWMLTYNPTRPFGSRWTAENTIRELFVDGALTTDPGRIHVRGENSRLRLESTNAITYNSAGLLDIELFGQDAVIKPTAINNTGTISIGPNASPQDFGGGAGINISDGLVYLIEDVVRVWSTANVSPGLIELGRPASPNETVTISDLTWPKGVGVAGQALTTDGIGQIVFATVATAAQGLLADSSVQPGDNISDLNNDAGYITSAPVTSVFGRTGVVVAQEGDYSIGQMSDVNTTGVAVGQILEWNGTNFVPGNKGTSGSSTFIGLTDTPANYTGSAGKLLAVNAGANAVEFIDAPQNAPVDSVFGRTGVVTAQAGDYSAFYATTAQGALADSSVQPGDNISTLVNDAGYITLAQVPAAPVTSVAGKTGIVTLALSDLTDVDTTGVAVGQVLEWDGSEFVPVTPSNAPVASVFGRTGAVVATSGDYNSTQITNGSGVSGATVTAALNTLNSNLGEDNTASNVGAGEGVFAQKSGVDLEFKSLVAGSNVTLTSDADEITINAAGASSTLQTIRVNYNGFGTIASVQDATAGITSTSIDTGQWINFTFAANHPPTSIMYYGYKDLGANGWGYKVTMPALGSTVNEVLTGGSSGNPAELLTNMAAGKIRLQARTNETLADVSQHAYIFFLF
jgi:hypothetical protein